jgi:hypothetical protein
MSGAFGIPGPNATDYELEMFANACRNLARKAFADRKPLVAWGSVSFTPAQLLKFADRSDIRRGVQPPKFDHFGED